MKSTSGSSVVRPALMTLATPFRVLVDPLVSVREAVESGRWAVPLILLMLAFSAVGGAVALRLDASRTVIPELQAKGELAKKSEREIGEAVAQSQRVGLVAGLGSGLAIPLFLLALALVLKLTAYVIGARASFGACFAAATLGMLPLGVKWLLVAGVALRQDLLTQASAARLVPSSLAFIWDGSGATARVLAATDFFVLWAAALMGLGFAAAAKLTPLRGVLVGLVLFGLYVAGFQVGIPGLAGGGAR